MKRYFIQDYYTGLDIITKNGYTRYFNTINEAFSLLNYLDKEGLNDEDNFFIIEEDEQGNQEPTEY